MAKSESYHTLTGPQKAALLIMGLPEEQAAKIFGLLDDEEIREISVVMASLGSISSQQVEQLYLDFVNEITNPGKIVGNYESAERFLAKALPKDRVAGIMEEIRGPAGKTMWDKLGNVNEQVLANYLKNEYPQTVAVILAKIKSDHAARVISLLPRETAMDVIMRLLHTDSVQKEVLDELEQTLRSEFMNNLARQTRRDPHELIAEMFNHMDRATESEFMGELEQRVPESAEKVQSMMFTFDDMIRLDSHGIQVLLSHVDKEMLAMALKGASDTIKELFFKNMSERAGKMMKEDMEALGPVRMKKIDNAQSEIIQIVKQLQDAKEIEIAEGSANDEIVY